MLTAAGYPWVLLETVGVGQVEVEVVGQADTTLVVVNPGWGDAVQANKAGLMEIADVFVVNKADRPGAKETARDLERMLDMAALEGWRPPVVCATAPTGDGVADVWQAVVDHRAHGEAGGELAERRRRRAAEEVTRLVAVRLTERARTATVSARGRELAGAVAAGEVDPWSAADELLGLDPGPDPDRRPGRGRGAGAAVGGGGRGNRFRSGEVEAIGSTCGTRASSSDRRNLLPRPSVVIRGGCADGRDGPGRRTRSGAGRGNGFHVREVEAIGSICGTWHSSSAGGTYCLASRGSLGPVRPGRWRGHGPEVMGSVGSSSSRVPDVELIASSSRRRNLLPRTSRRSVGAG